MRAPVPRPHEVGVTVVNNNSTDATQAVMNSLVAIYGPRLCCIPEPNQGSSHSRNAGIRSTSGDLIGFVDDDETVVDDWYHVAFGAFSSHPDIGFVGGPYLPDWEEQAPVWLPDGYLAAVGIKYGSSTEAVFHEDETAGMLMGGNAVIRRRCIERVGLFDPNLGRTNRGLLSAEDEEFYDRLLAAGIKGLFLPSMAIRHFIPASRCTKKYHRSWCFWRGVSNGYRMRGQEAAGRTWAGIPRWHYRQALSGLLRAGLGIVLREKAGAAFAGELGAWDLAGLWYGRHFWNPPRSK